MVSLYFGSRKTIHPQRTIHSHDHRREADGRASVSSPRRAARILQPTSHHLKPPPGALGTDAPYHQLCRRSVSRITAMVSLCFGSRKTIHTQRTIHSHDHRKEADGRAPVSSPRRAARILQPSSLHLKPQPGALGTDAPYPLLSITTVHRTHHRHCASGFSEWVFQTVPTTSINRRCLTRPPIRC